jgi:hypothetical protein
MFCCMLCSDAHCCYNSSCGYRLFPCFFACCVVMHSVVITAISNHRSCYNNTVHHYTTYDKSWEQSVTTRTVIKTLCIATQHTTNHGCCYNSSCGYRLFPCFVVCCVVMHSVVIIAPVVTDCSHVLSYVV